MTEKTPINQNQDHSAHDHGSFEEDRYADFVKYTDTGERRPSALVTQDELALHQYKLAKAVYNEILKDEEAEEQFELLKQAREIHKQVKQERMQNVPHHHHHHHHHHSGYHHIGHQNFGNAAKQYEKDLAEGKTDEESKKKKEKGTHEQILKPAHVKKRHRISKKRFMKCIDYDLMKTILTKARLDNSLLLKEDFDAASLGLETFISTRQDMLKLEVIMEALKEGLLDKFGAYYEKQETHIPTEEELVSFEKAKKLLLAKIQEEEEEQVLENARKRAAEQGIGKSHNQVQNDTKAMQDLLKDTRSNLINAEQQRQIDGDATEDAYTKLIKKLQSPDASEDEWSLSTSTTTGSYLSWRRNEEEIVHKPVGSKLKKPHWGDGSKHLLIRFVAGMIIFGYWVFYIHRGVEKTTHDIFSEQLQNYNILPMRRVRDSSDWSYIWIKCFHWFHLFFTLIAPITVLGNHTALGVFYGLSIMTHGFIYMYEIGHDRLFEPPPTWRKVFHQATHAILFSGMVVVFFIFHYIVEDPVRKAREFYHRKTSRINRVLFAKCLGNFEQRMFAWDWMINHARKREIQKLAKLYPDIEKVNGHFPVPERKYVNFNLPRELRLFRFRHVFNDITIRGGWINMEQYQDELFGSNESSSDEDLAIGKTMFKHATKKKETKEDEEQCDREMFGERENENEPFTYRSKNSKDIRVSDPQTTELFEGRRSQKLSGLNEAQEQDIINFKKSVQETNKRGTTESQISDIFVNTEKDKNVRTSTAELLPQVEDPSTSTPQDVPTSLKELETKEDKKKTSKDSSGSHHHKK